MSGLRLKSESSKPGLFFRRWLPRRNRENRPIQVDGLAFVPGDIKSKKILIVDDDVITLNTLSTKLTNVGYQVVTAVDGSDAIRAMREERPDLILLDMHFPPDVSHGGGVPWDGFTLMKWLSGMEQGQRIPIVLITGSTEPGIRERALASGATGLFEKPIDHVRLLDLVQKALAGQGEADSGFQP